jgi:uncharacterized protein with PIN domain
LIVINAIEEDRADASDVMLASEEIIMTTIKSLRQSSKCAACGEWLIAPERSTYVSEEQVSNLWVCPKCANEFETSIYLTQEVPLTPEMVDTFFPTLLVA